MHWRLLVAVADCGSITGAAERVNLTQSGASQAIAALEDMLGVRLFTRERRQTVPTAVGLQVIDHARAMLAALEQIQSAADAAKGLSGGSIRLASFPVVLQAVLPPLLRRFRQRHPGIDVVTLEASDEEVEALLAAGTIDVGTVVNPSPQRNASPLGRDPWLAVVPAGHRLARPGRRGVVALAELAAEPFILATGGCEATALGIITGAGLDLADVRARVRDWSSGFALVREGVGVTLVPELTLPVDRRGLQVLRLAEPVHRAFGLVASESGARSRAVQALFDLLQEPA
ncbi:LysR family transcriptional regulator [Bradyrhizobium sp. 2TAF24]|uniref:LysR family transcriptional regulator n=1 Tax=Bradyrhizobium sp. 2TAF24 TaxID=3233011 RepID=UPI003F905DB9